MCDISAMKNMLLVKKKKTHTQIDSNLNKLNGILKILQGGKALIAADTNARSKTWHDHFTNSRGKKVEEFIAASYLHIINEHSANNTFCNTRGVSNIDLTSQY